MTELSKLEEGFSSKDHNYLRVFQAIRNQGKDVLYQVLLWGWPNDVPVSEMGQFLLNKSKHFTNTDKGNIKSSPDGKCFDVTLLHKVIKIACVNVASFSDNVWFAGNETQLEFLVTKIKDKRNDIYHSQEPIDKSTMIKEIEVIRSLLCKTIEAAGVRFGIDKDKVDNIVSTINYNLNIIRTGDLARNDIDTYQKELIHEHLTKHLKIKGSEELREHIRKIAKLNPFHFLDGSDYFLEVGDVFSRIEVEQADQKQNIDYKDILKLRKSSEGILRTSDEGEVATLLLLEGKPGYGKTTLFKFILSDWEREVYSINGLETFDLVLPVMCRDSHVSSFSELLTLLMNDTRKSFQSTEDFISCAHNLKLLILVDGLDEMTEQSKHVLKDLFSRKKILDMTVLCTSRPETVNNFKNMLPCELVMGHLKITGVPEELRGEFVRKYHEEMIKNKTSDNGTTGLVEYINRTSSKLQHHFHSPLNLILLTHLWSKKSYLVSDVTTATEFYMHVDRLRIEKLIEKLASLDCTRDGLKQDCLRFEKALLAEALLCISQNHIHLTEASKDRLKTTCTNLGISFKQVLYHYLVMKGSVTESGTNETVVSFPHLDIHDYYGASAIYFALWNDDYFCFIKEYGQKQSSLADYFLSFFKSRVQSCPIPPTMSVSSPLKIKRKITEVLEAVHGVKVKQISLTRYRNVFKHLAGLLGQHLDQVPDDLALELLRLFSRSGVVNKGDWLEILQEVKCDATTAKYMAKFISQSLRGHVYISDREVGIYASLMPYAKPTKITLELASNPREIARLPELLKAIGCHGARVDLKFHHDFDHMVQSDALIEYLKSGKCILKCNTTVFIGHMLDMSLLPNTIEDLSLSLKNDDQALCVSSLTSVFPKLKKIELLISQDVEVSSMLKLPVMEHRPIIHFRMLDQNLVKWVCEMLVNMQNEKGFSTIIFRDCSLTLDQATEFIKDLKANHIIVADTLTLSSSSLAEHKSDLTAHTRSELNCTLKF